MAKEMTPPINAAEIERLARLATPGPWKVGDNKPHGIFQANSTDPYALATAEKFSEDDRYPRDENSAFIASANPQTILTLIAALREARSGLEEASEWVCSHFGARDAFTKDPERPRYWCGDCENWVRDRHDAHVADRIRQALRSIAEKVEGL